jgi:hypothetical protein
MHWIWILLAAGAVQAQLTELWTVTQPAYEVGWAVADLNGDGVEELLKEDGIYSVFYDGADAYAPVWTVVDPDPGSDTVFYLWLIGGNSFVFLQQNESTQESRLHVYAPYGEAPSWSTPILGGNITQGVIDDLEQDGSPEIAWSWHVQSGSSWSSAWELRRLNSGGVIHTGLLESGYLAGPWMANLEGDVTRELIFNWYYDDGSAQLSCWGLGTALGSTVRPVSTESGIAVWPNPFNPACRIKLPGDMSSAGPVRIYSMDGRLVRSLHPAGRSLIWDGMDKHGRLAASATYLLQAGSKSRTITLSR